MGLDARVFLQPETLELGQISEPADFREVGDLVLPDVEFLEVLAVLHIGQGRDAVDAVK